MIENLAEQLATWQELQAEATACTYREPGSKDQLLALLTKQQCLKQAIHDSMINSWSMIPLTADHSLAEQQAYLIKIAEICACMKDLTDCFNYMQQDLLLHALLAKEPPTLSFDIVSELAVNMQTVYGWEDEHVQRNLESIQLNYPDQHSAILALVQQILG